VIGVARNGDKSKSRRQSGILFFSLDRQSNTLNGISGETQTNVTFSKITLSFRFGPKVLVQGMALAVAMGLIGGLFPAIRATRLQFVNTFLLGC
jgi:ABC-type antimicrobial peptide transport system permease subunit